MNVYVLRVIFLKGDKTRTRLMSLTCKPEDFVARLQAKARAYVGIGWELDDFEVKFVTPLEEQV